MPVTYLYILVALMALALTAVIFLWFSVRKDLEKETTVHAHDNARHEEKTREIMGELDIANDDLKDLRQSHAALMAESERRAATVEMLRGEALRQAEAYKAEEKERQERFDRQLKAAQDQIRLMAQQVLEQQAARLKSVNAEDIGQATTPLKEAISEMRKALGDNAKTAAEQSAAIKEQIQRMMETSAMVGEKAESLINVLRRDNKLAGNMGEIILGDLLKAQGLTEGVQYDVQPRIRNAGGQAVRNDDTGSEMQPDVILHYPQGQDIIIDSKVSMTAYERYVNTDDGQQKAQFLKEHINSVRRHVAELARKDYSKYVQAPREAVDFVVMFVPFESSLQLALANDARLWRDAFERKVFITSEQNLSAIIHIVQVAWIQHQQTENQKKVFSLAEQLLDRLGDFNKRYEDLGEKLRKASQAYEETGNKLISGNQSVYKTARRMIDLGAKENPNRRIPEAD